MKKLAILLAVLLPVTAHSGVRSMAPEKVVAKYFQKACVLSSLDCRDIAPPALALVDTPNGLMGYHYRGTNVVFVTDRCVLDVADRAKCEGVIVHEIVHYIASELGKFEGDSCSNEQLAWAVYNKYVLLQGRPDLLRLDWRASYPRCA